MTKHIVTLSVTTTASEEHADVVAALTEVAAANAYRHQSVSVTSVDMTQPYDGPEEDPVFLIHNFRKVLSDSGLVNSEIDNTLDRMRKSNLTIRSIS
jgi:hypothetical protein